MGEGGLEICGVWLLAKMVDDFNISHVGIPPIASGGQWCRCVSDQ